MRRRKCLIGQSHCVHDDGGVPAAVAHAKSRRCTALGSRFEEREASCNHCSDNGISDSNPPQSAADWGASTRRKNRPPDYRAEAVSQSRGRKPSTLDEEPKQQAKCARASPFFPPHSKRHLARECSIADARQEP
jgi:hypothetical protein